MPLLQAVITTNLLQPLRIRTILDKHFESLNGVRVAVLGLAFKPDTDDMRESPAVPIIKNLAADGAVLSVYDPVAMHESQKVLNGTAVRYASSLANCIEGVEAIVLVTRWKEFESLPAMLEGRSPQPLVVDGRRLLDKKTIERYEGIGL
jgi:UDPglucose 6-dehydrogenase/GDP-mannose 6-dehydrogenase